MILPNFQHDVKGKLPFVVVNRKHSNVQNASEPNDTNISDDIVFTTSDEIDENSSERFVILPLILFRIIQNG